jgi:hypothetical protein
MTNKLVDDQVFANMIAEYFDFDDNIYDVINEYNHSRDVTTLNKLPMFFREALSDPRSLESFLNSIYDMMANHNIMDRNIAVYNGANIFTVITAGIFHLCKLSKIINQNNADNFIDYYKEFLHKCVDEFTDIDYSQHTRAFASPLTYMILMFPFERDTTTAYYLFTTALLENSALQFNIKYIDDILMPLFDIVGDVYEKDLQNNLALYAKNIESLMIVNSDIFTEREITDASSIVKYVAVNIFEELKMSDVNEIQNMNKLRILIFLNNNTTDFLFEVTDTGIKNDYKWQELLDVFWYFIENSDDLDECFATILENFEDGSVKSSDFFHIEKQENLLFPIVRNKHFNDNAEFIRLIFFAVLNNDWDPISDEVMSSEAMQHIISKNDLTTLNRQEKDVLLTFLEHQIGQQAQQLSRLTLGERSLLKIPSLSSRQPLIDDSIYSFYYSPNRANDNQSETATAADAYKLNAYKKMITDGLIRYAIKTVNAGTHKVITTQTRNWYFKQILAKYYKPLQDMGIDLHSYRLNKKVLSSAPSIKSNRSAYTQELVKKKDISNTFFKTFKNENLLKLLTKLYIRSVQTNINADNDFDRLVKIRKYFIKKYLPVYDYQEDDYSEYVNIRGVKENKELEAFYKHTRNLANVNIKYRIKRANVQDQTTIDAGGVLKQFFNNMANQVKREYFQQISDGSQYISERYILKDGISAEKAKFVGQVLALFIIYNVTLPFNISNVYLGYMMFDYDKISDEELFLYYLLDLDVNKKTNFINACSSDDKSVLTEYCSPGKIIADYIQPIYNQNGKVFKAFLSGFFIEKKHFHYVHRLINDKIRIFDLNKLLCSKEETTPTAYKKYVFDKITLRTSNIDAEGENEIIKESDPRVPPLFAWLKEFFLTDTNATFKEMYNAHQLDDPLVKTVKPRYKTRASFCSAILLFWSGLERIDISKGSYLVTVVEHSDKIISHTCFNDLELPGIANINSKQELYNVFMNIFIFNVHQSFGII